jgi:DNA replication protein DnaC
MKSTQNEQRDIFELLHHRRKKSSTIFCSQYRSDGWYKQLGGDASPLADAILGRIVHDGYVIDIVSVDTSKDLFMREVYGLSDTDRM